MYPRVRPEQVYPRPVEEYADQLGGHQAEAFRLLWNFLGARDPMANVDGAHWHLNRAFTADGSDAVRLAPPDLLTELSETTRLFVLNEKPSAVDVNYLELFVIIAGWQQELVQESITAFEDFVYA